MIIEPLWIMMDHSAAVGLDTPLHSLAYHAHHQGVLATVHAERNAAANACEEEQGKTPNPGHSSWRLLREIFGLSAAEGAGQPAAVGLESLVVGLEALILVGRGRRNEALVALIGSISLVGIGLVVPSWRELVVGVLRAGRALIVEQGLVGNVRVGVDSTVVHDMQYQQLLDLSFTHQFSHYTSFISNINFFLPDLPPPSRAIFNSDNNQYQKPPWSENFKSPMSQSVRASAKLRKTFVLQRQDTHQSLIFQQQLNLSPEYINLNHIFAKYCHPKHHRINIYHPQHNAFLNIKRVNSRNGWISRAVLQPQFILIRYCSRQDLATRDESESSAFELDSREKKEERSKERTIGEVLELVKRWRNLHQTCPKPNNKKKKLNLQEAAKIVGISKKSLDDYYCQLRLAESFAFDFQGQINQKIGVLRTFVKNHKGVKEKAAKAHKKHPKDLRVIHDSPFPSHSNHSAKEQVQPVHSQILQHSMHKKEEEPGVFEEQKLNDLEHEFYRGFEFLLDQPMDPFLNLNRNFSVRLSDDESNSLIFF